MTVEHLTEAAERTVSLTPAQAQALGELGRNLASKATHWSEYADSDEEDGPPRNRAVIRCWATDDPHRWRVQVTDVIGLITIDGLQLEIRPKIPTQHFLHLMTRAGSFPRVAEALADAEPDDHLWELVARAYVAETDDLLRLGLLRNYEEKSERLRVVRGRVHALATASDFYRGRIGATCTYEEFTVDTAFNRTLKAAASVIAGSSTLSFPLRRAGRRISLRLDEVGRLRPGDLAMPLERRLGHYRDAVTLARHIIRREGRSLTSGTTRSWSFLLRTPDLVESAVLQILQERLDSRHLVRKRGKKLPGSGLTVNPDLLFGRQLAVGDVKYKLAQGGWRRPDLYEVVAFAAAFRCRDATLIQFSDHGAHRPSPALIGEHRVVELVWRTDHNAQTAEDDLVASVSSWLATCERRALDSSVPTEAL